MMVSSLPHVPPTSAPVPSATPAIEEVVLPTSGFCMVPWIWPAGQLNVRRCSLADLRQGEIAVWFDGSIYLSHRVMHISANTFVTRGDFSRGDDPEGRDHQLNER